MPKFPSLLGVVSILVSCSQAPTIAPAPVPEASPHVQAADPATAETLIVQGGMAIRAEQWAEAARLFASAYDRAAEAEQGKVAFYWGLALYRQGEAIAKANLEGDEELAHRARQYFEEARTVLQDAEHPMRARVLQAIDQFLLIQIADRGT